MKIKKIAIAITLITILLAQFIFIQINNTLAVGETTPSLTIQLKSSSDLNNLNRGNQFEIIARMKELNNIGKGIVVIGATLGYDTEKLELVSIVGAGEGEEQWKITRNQGNGKFVLEHDGYVNADNDILKMQFKVKDNAVESTEAAASVANIGLSSITASGGNGVVRVTDVIVSATIVKPVEKEKKITSTVYKIDNNDKDISKIEPQTTIAQFLKNVTTENVEANEIVFTDKNGTVTNNNNTILRTGMKIKIADKLTYTLIVKGDLDGEIGENGEVVTENDLAIIKLHFIGHTPITDVTILKAANYDDDGKREITVNDIAMIKLNILGLLNVNN